MKSTTNLKLKKYNHLYYEKNKTRLLKKSEKWYNLHKEKMITYRKIYNKKNKYRIWINRRKPTSRFILLQSQAKSRSYPVTISFGDFQNFLTLPCHYCGKKFNRGCGHGLDRINSEKGYEKNNIVPCCVVCNRMKLRMSITKFLRMVKLIYNNRVKENVANF